MLVTRYGLPMRSLLAMTTLVFALGCSSPSGADGAVDAGPACDGGMGRATLAGPGAFAVSVARLTGRDADAGRLFSVLLGHFARAPGETDSCQSPPPLDEQLLLTLFDPAAADVPVEYAVSTSSAATPTSPDGGPGALVARPLSDAGLSFEVATAGVVRLERPAACSVSGTLSVSFDGGAPLTGSFEAVRCP